MIKFIFLIGMPGVGKTYWGKKLAEHLRMRFVDLDDFIEDREDDSILALFAQQGEEKFREMERNALHAVLADNTVPTVVACGGGTPCFFDNMDKMKEAGCVIFLRAEMDTLLSRLFVDIEFRPLLQADSVHDKLYQLAGHRMPVYKRAHHILEVETVSVNTFEEIILQCTSEP
ncbi:shikimate kinase [Taibaiella soli]|uniref:Shikimate kinase n=1 Tax=Taibaiella soli TaxID=1649169 RepID=A0A2W2AFB6_9BACT|nr:shikimate kinase [Taibaiella soli]PZF74175.1 shikimate kinase [Taibaiella soli]